MSSTGRVLGSEERRKEQAQRERKACAAEAEERAEAEARGTQEDPYVVPPEAEDPGPTRGRRKANATKRPDRKKGKWKVVYPHPIEDFMSRYITTLGNVPGDGHCGFHSLAALVGCTATDAWMWMRRWLLEELMNNPLLYERICDTSFTSADMYASLDCWTPIAPEENWLMMPYVGLVFATLFQRPLCLLSPVLQNAEEP